MTAISTVTSDEWTSVKSIFCDYIKRHTSEESIEFILEKSLEVLCKNYGVFIKNPNWRQQNKNRIELYVENLMFLAFKVTDFFPTPDSLSNVIKKNSSKKNIASVRNATEVCSSSNNINKTNGMRAPLGLLILSSTGYLIADQMGKVNNYYAFYTAIATLCVTAPLSLYLFFKNYRSTVTSNKNSFFSNTSNDELDLKTFYSDISIAALGKLTQSHNTTMYLRSS